MLLFRFSSKQLYTTYLRHQKEPSEIMKHSKARGEPNIKDQIKNKIKKRNLTDSVPGSRTLRYREICASTWEAEMLPIHQYGHLLCENGLYLFIWGIKCRLLFTALPYFGWHAPHISDTRVKPPLLDSSGGFVCGYLPRAKLLDVLFLAAAFTPKSLRLLGRHIKRATCYRLHPFKISRRTLRLLFSQFIMSLRNQARRVGGSYCRVISRLTMDEI